MATRKTTVLAFGAQVIEDCRRAGKLGTAKNYEKTMNSFGTFIRQKMVLLSDGGACIRPNRSASVGKRGAKDIPFSRMSGEIIMEYEHWLYSRGCVRNSSSFYMRNLRAVFNRAVEVGIAPECNPFRQVYTGVDRTRKRAVDEDFIIRLQCMDLHRSAPLALARDLFIFSYCTRGMAFVDVAFLRKCDINDGVISYIRRKTGQRLTVRLEPCMEKIICRYACETVSSRYVFPIITSADPEIAYQQYRIALNYHNRKLKRLTAMLGTDLNLSTYTARHTWATTARNSNIPISVISAGMGHSSEKTTQIYLAALDNSVIDQANRGIVGKLNGVGSA